MKSSEYSEVIVDDKDLFESLYNGLDIDFTACKFDNKETVKRFNQAVSENADNISKLSLYSNPNLTKEEFDKQNQENWFLPEGYAEFPIVEFLLDKTTNEAEYQRVVMELELYIQHNMMPVLIYLKYLVDFMREKNIVWGLGRGSSIASYCLYLLGVHKVNSLKYELDIKEFLK